MANQYFTSITHHQSRVQQGFVRMRFLKKTDGTVSVEEFTEVTGDGAQRVGHLRAADRVRRMFGD